MTVGGGGLTTSTLFAMALTVGTVTLTFVVDSTSITGEVSTLTFLVRESMNQKYHRYEKKYFSFSKGQNKRRWHNSNLVWSMGKLWSKNQTCVAQMPLLDLFTASRGSNGNFRSA